MSQDALFPMPDGEPPIGRLIPSRRSDPTTSHAAEKRIRVAANNQRGKLLRAYAGATYGLTDDEAQARAGVSFESCYWKRCSELRDAGFIATTGTTRTGRAGVQRIVCALTASGRQVINQIGTS